FDCLGPRKLLEEKAQVSIGFETACLGRLDETEERCAGMRSIGMSREEPVLPTYHERANGIFSSVIIRRDMPVFQIADQLGPMVEGIGEGFAQKPLGRCQPDSLVDPGLELKEDAFRLLPAKLSELRR